MHILCLVYTVQPLDNNFITCVNIHKYEYLGRKRFEKGYLTACVTYVGCLSKIRTLCHMN